MTAPPPGPARPRSRASRARVRASLVPACSPLCLCVPEAAEGSGGDPGACISENRPWRARLGSEDADSALESRRGRPRSGPGEAGGPGGRGAAVRWLPGELLGEPRGLVSGLHRGERRRLTAQALRGFFQSQLPNWVRSGRQSGSREASNRKRPALGEAEVSRAVGYLV